MKGDGSSAMKNTPESGLYNAIKLRLSLYGYAVDAAVLLVFAFSGVSVSLAGYFEFYFINEYVRYLLFMLTLSSVFFVIGTAFDLYSTFVIEKDFGFLKLTPVSWIIEKLKSVAISVVFLAPLSILFFWIVRNFPDSWWWMFSAVLVFLSVVLARIAPVLILPLFYKLTPLADESLKGRINALIEGERVRFKGIYSFNLSKKSTKANAGFTGMGSSKKIILSDTLLDSFTEEEIVSVFAHELGHYRRFHILKNLIVSTSVVFLSMFFCHAVSSYLAGAYGFMSISEIPAIPMLLFLLFVFSLATLPLINMISRRFEYEADSFAVRRTGAEPFVSAMKRLSEKNLANLEPHPFIEWFFYSHPSIPKRIKAAEAIR
jgi:STE24 endopeptidase